MMMFAEIGAHLEKFAFGVVGSIVFGAIGIGLMMVAFKLFEKLTPKLNVEEELGKGNMAVAIVVGAMLLAIGLILMLVISS
jgi:putative membrane protein